MGWEQFHILGFSLNKRLLSPVLVAAASNHAQYQVFPTGAKGFQGLVGEYGAEPFAVDVATRSDTWMPLIQRQGEGCSRALGRKLQEIGTNCLSSLGMP